MAATLARTSTVVRPTNTVRPEEIIGVRGSRGQVRDIRGQFEGELSVLIGVLVVKRGCVWYRRVC